MTRVLRRIGDYGELVKFEHTVFALPFAAMGAALATRYRGMVWPSLRSTLWVLVAMVCARTAAMAFNRLVDADIDARNPRTAMRAIPAGVITRKSATALTLFTCAGLVVSAGMLGPLCLALSPVALAAVLSYSLAKRFTSWSHLWLGAAIGIAPTGAWLALGGPWHAAPLMLSAAVALWVGGFDVLYSLQDEGFDRREGLNSAPVRLGPARAMALSSLMHLGAVVFLLGVYAVLHLGYLYLAGVAVSAALLGYEHSIVRPNDLSRLNMAFFAVNGWLSVTLCLLSVLDGVVRR
ncbi:MAG: putative 4-hydroxybenzoate polyprenyltransferase [Armatimonadetes bacterium]|nr:putative 4-hydroxybenzoate polyprenyltransferase [Armatimonadota bacterium]